MAETKNKWVSLGLFHPYKWVFPKIEVPPNHPFLHRVFHETSPSILGYPVPLIFTERLVVGCGFCTFGDPLNLQLVRIVQSRTHSKPFMSHSHASASCTPLSSVHFTTAPSEKKTRENQKIKKQQKKQKNKDLATSPEIRVVLETLFFLFFLFFLVFSSFCCFRINLD